MIKIFKSKDSKNVFIRGVADGTADDFIYARDGDYFAIDRINTNIKEVNNTHFSKFQDFNGNTFNSANEFELYLISEIENEYMISQQDLVSYVDNNAYNPTIIFYTESISEKPISQTFNLNISGEFLDSITDVDISTVDENNINAVIIEKTFNNISIDVTTNDVVQNYVINLKKGDNNIKNFNFSTSVFTLVTPSLNGSGESLWVKPSVANNDAVVSFGIFEAQNSNGNGWNDHAYYGNFNGSFTKIVHEFTIDRLNGASNNYGHIRFNNTNNSATNGSPRIQIYAGGTTTIFNQLGQSIGGIVFQENDNIRVEFTQTSMDVFQNGNNIMSHTGAYINSMQGSYVNWTFYRVGKFINIQTKLID